jgi:ketosteroid isomerase-like protein
MQIVRRAAIAILLLTLAAASPASAAEAKGAEAVLLAGTEAWIKAYNAGDVDTIVAMYADDAIVMPPGVPALKGRAALRTYLPTELAAAKAAGVTLVLGKVRDAGVSGDLGWDSGDYVVRDKSGAVVDSGNYLAVWRKVGGKWLYIRDMWNSDRAPAPAAAPK